MKTKNINWILPDNHTYIENITIYFKNNTHTLISSTKLDEISLDTIGDTLIVTGKEKNKNTSETHAIDINEIQHLQINL